MSGIAIAAFIILALIGVPLFAIFGAASMMLFHGLENTPITGAANDVFGEKFANSLLLITIPLFTFSGYLMAESGTPKRLVRLSSAIIGWLPGGLAIVALLSSAFFTTFTGGSGITIVAIGGLLFPALRQSGYEEKFSLGMVTTGGSLGLLFPPSVPVILYGVVAGVLIEKLFYGGFLPGLLTLVALGTYSVFVGLRHQMPVRAFEAKEAAAALWDAKWELLLPVVLIGSMVAGVLRIHEAAAFTAVYVLMIEVFVYRDIAPRRLPQVIRDSMTLVGAIMLILATAIGFTAFLVQAEVPQKLLESMEVMVKDPFTFLLALNVFLILVGMLMDIFSAIVVVVPLVVPIANYFGIDPYHLGIVFLLNLEIGYLTPPVGLNLFIASFRFEKPVTLLYRAVLPFIALLLVALALTTYGEAYLWNAGEGTVCTSDAECEEGLFGQICSLDPPTEENTERVRRCQRRGVVTALMSLHEGEEIFEFEPAVGGPAAKTEEETASSTEESSESLDELFQEFEDESDPAEGESLDDILRELESDFSTP